MPRRKAPQIPDVMLDHLLSGTKASAAFEQGGLLDQLKKALAERALDAEMDHTWPVMARPATVAMATIERTW